MRKPRNKNRCKMQGTNLPTSTHPASSIESLLLALLSLPLSRTPSSPYLTLSAMLFDPPATSGKRGWGELRSKGSSIAKLSKPPKRIIHAPHCHHSTTHPTSSHHNRIIFVFLAFPLLPSLARECPPLPPPTQHSSSIEFLQTVPRCMDFLYEFPRFVTLGQQAELAIKQTSATVS